jgi:hypothetical protein
MSSILSYETAKRLKDAGFPQPKFDIGQIWYCTGKATINTHFNTEGMLICSFLETGQRVIVAEIFYGGHFCFSPTATDILRELGFEFQGYFTAIVNEFVCLQDGAPGVKSWQHENPAEACAMAWLFIHEKSETK